MILVSVHIPEVYLSEIQRLVEQGYFPTRAEAIRCAIRDLLKSEYYKANEERLKKLREQLGLDF